MTAQRYGGDTEEYIGEMYEYLCKAADYYDPDRGFAWSTYAMRTMLSNVAQRLSVDRRRVPLPVDPSALNARVASGLKVPRRRSIIEEAMFFVQDDEDTTRIFRDVLARRSWRRSLSRTEYGIGRREFYRGRTLLRELVEYIKEQRR